jgi:hypothetical protein
MSKVILGVEFIFTILCGCFIMEIKRIDILNTWKKNGKNNHAQQSNKNIVR